MQPNPMGNKAKAWGAYYTDEAIAAFLTRWAVRDPASRVIDPSFGGGIFLEAALQRITELGGNAAEQVYGVELDPTVHKDVGVDLSRRHALNLDHLVPADFFDLECDRLPAFDAVIGNPPFIRYQTFSGETREKARRRSAEQGVVLNGLTSSWAPFLVHGVSLLRRGGNLAMVIPMEIGHAAYAKPTLEFLTRSFAYVTFLTFRFPLFPDLSQDTLLLLGQSKGKRFRSLGWKDLGRLDDLGTMASPIRGRRKLDHEALVSGRDRLITAFIEPRARELYQALARSSNTVRLGELAQVGIGYVSGGNDFFHLSPSAAKKWQLPESVMSRCVYRGRAFSGLRFTDEDWNEAAHSGSAGFLLRIDDGQPVDERTLAYLGYGEERGVHHAYKCRARTPWYRVPNVYHPDAFLTYMSGLRPELVINDAGTVAPNTLHVMRFRERGDFTAEAAAVAWYSSLVGLSTEIEGHALGGGMLKLEPSEAQRVILPKDVSSTPDLALEIDHLVRTDRANVAAERVDQEVLQRRLGLSLADCNLLKEAAQQLRNRRYQRGRAA